MLPSPLQSGERMLDQHLLDRPAVHIRVVQWLSLAGAVVALLALLRFGDGLDLGVVLLGPWAILPFAIAYSGTHTQPESRARVVGLGVVSALALALYVAAFPWSRYSTTAGLALVLVPLGQTLACAAVLVTTRKQPPS
jgi:uncharacterized membrane protein YjjP (DUF1212 family)